MAVTVEIGIAGNGDDTSGRRSTVTGWANISSGTYLDNPDSAPHNLGVGNSDWGGTSFASSNVFMRFNTGAVLPDNAIVISASLKVVPTDRQGTQTYAADFYDYGGSPSIAADWEILSSGNAIESFNVLTLDTINTIPLTGLSGVSTTGYTGLRFAEITSAEPTTDSWMDFAGYEDVTYQEPRLEITYILPGDCQAADIFDRADGNLTTPWETFADWDAMQIISNTVWGDGEPSGSIYTDATFDDDQWASCIIATENGTTNDTGIGLMLRASDSSENCYTAVVNNDGEIAIGKYVAGSYTSLSIVAATLADGERLRFEAEGTTLRVYRNEVFYGETTDSSHTGGYPGVCRIGTSGVNLADFFAGSLYPSPSIVGISSHEAQLATGSGTIIVPDDAEFAVAMYAHWDPTPDTIDYIRIDGDDFTPRQLMPPVGGAPGTGIFTMDTLPAPGPYDITWGWLAGGNQDEGGGIYVVFLKDINSTSPFRDVGADAGEGADPVAAQLATAPGDFVLGLNQLFGSSPGPKAYALIDGDLYNSEYFDVSITAPSSGISTLIPCGPLSYPSQTYISLVPQDAEEDVVTIPIATANDDTDGGWEDANGAWPPNDTYTDEQGNLTLWAWKQDQGGAGTDSNAFDIYLRFDTSSLPDSATITSAILSGYVHADTEDGTNLASLVGDYYDFGGGVSTGADWIETASPSIFSAYDLTDLEAIENRVVYIPLTDLSGIDPEGYTGIRLTLSAYTAAFNHDSAVFASYEHTYWQEMRLTVSYTEEVEEEETPGIFIPMRWTGL